jgi:hypothetical protein
MEIENVLVITFYFLFHCKYLWLIISRSEVYHIYQLHKSNLAVCRKLALYVLCLVSLQILHSVQTAELFRSTLHANVHHS